MTPQHTANATGPGGCSAPRIWPMLSIVTVSTPTPHSPARRLAPWDAAADHRRLRFAAAMALLVVATLAEYSTGLRAPFQFDDLDGIVENITIRRLWPIVGTTGACHRPPQIPFSTARSSTSRSPSTTRSTPR